MYNSIFNKLIIFIIPTEFLFGLLPDYVLPYVIYLLSHDSKWTKLDDVEILNKIKRCVFLILN